MNTKTVASQTTTYQYDVLGNLIAVTLPNGTHLSYIIDAENNRVGKEVNGVLASGFLYDGGNIVAQLNSSNQIVSQFVYSGVSNTPKYMISGGVTYRIFADQLGSPRLVINCATGQIMERIDFDEFGNVTNDTNAGFQPFGFAGGLYDQDTKLVRFGERDYDATTGRWTAKDPILFSGGDSNLYTYGSNDPVNRTDISGNDASDVGLAFLEAYFTATGQSAIYSWSKDVCKGILRAQDVGATEAVKDAAYKKATKGMNTRDEYAKGVTEATKSIPCGPETEQCRTEGCGWHQRRFVRSRSAKALSVQVAARGIRSRSPGAERLETTSSGRTPATGRADRLLEGLAGGLGFRSLGHEQGIGCPSIGEDSGQQFERPSQSRRERQSKDSDSRYTSSDQPNSSVRLHIVKF